MLVRLAKGFLKLEGQKQALLVTLQRWPHPELLARLSSGAWCALEVVEHLILTEQAVLAMMRANLPSPHRVTLWGTARNALVISAMLLPTRVRVPAGVSSVIPSLTQSTLDCLEANWSRTRREYAALLESLTVADAANGIVCHPVGGWTTAAGGILFLRSHLYHHTRQIARIHRGLRPSS